MKKYILLLSLLLPVAAFCQTTNLNAANQTVLGNATDNSANSTTKLPVIPCVANAAPPAWTEGNQVPCSTDKSGNARVIPSSLGVVDTERGGTITSGGTAQNAMSANTARKSWCIQNDPAATENLFVRADGNAATTTSGTALSPGSQVCSRPSMSQTSAVSVIAATTGHRFYATETQ